jgi:hypothetical protein
VNVLRRCSPSQLRHEELRFAPGLAGRNVAGYLTIQIQQWN